LKFFQSLLEGSHNVKSYMTFKELVSNPHILQALEELGYTTPTPIQAAAIPKVLEGLDLLASAGTGTGKTAAFMLPSLCRIADHPSFAGKAAGPNAKGPRILVLVPTRELAIQVAAETAKFSKHLPRMKTVCVYGGTPYPVEIRALRMPYEILVATPGRLIDHLERGRINLSKLDVLILDEADRMLDMGFIEPVERIAAATPPSRQTLLFSATMKGNVLKLSQKLLKNPIEVEIAADPVQKLQIEQKVQAVDNVDHKYKILDHILADPTVTQAIIFTGTKRQADRLADKLQEDGLTAAPLHGDMNQRQRTRTIAQMRQGKIRILVATDVAARGIDVPTISHVINFDMPMSTEDYVHRIGRTGRAGASGTALLLATHREMRFVKQIERFTGQKMTLHTIPGLEAKFKDDPFQARKPQTRTFRPRRSFSRGRPR
jgi:superfamily II DNA/RNA helicase